MSVPEWFKKRKGKCTTHGCDYVEFDDKKKQGQVYCPKCVQEANKKSNGGLN